MIRTKLRTFRIVLYLALLVLTTGVMAQRGGRGGGMRGASGAHAGAMKGGMSRPVGRPSTPNMGGNRANVGRTPGHYNFNRPNVSRPQTLPGTTRPTFDQPTARPFPNRPPISRPNGGLKPGGTSNLTRPGSRPNIIRPGGDKPGGTGINRPNLPNLGGGGITRPNLPNLGGGGINRPNLPNLGGGTTRPAPGGKGRPGNIAGKIDRPNLGGGGIRPRPGNVGDFLGLDRPLRPGPNRPGVADRFDNRQDRIGNRGDRIANRGDRIDNRGDRIPNRGDFKNRPGGRGDINIGDIRIGRNHIINRRPSWANINRDRINHINNSWRSQIGSMHGWRARHPTRDAYWRGWADGVRGRWNHRRNHFHAFNRSWWINHPHNWCGWHYGHVFDRRPWYFWWNRPVWGNLVTWFSWSAPTVVWSNPVFFDYGPGGNVTFVNNSVHINNQPVASIAEFAQSAAELATVPPPANEAEAQMADWMPLGTFSISTNQKDVDPNRIIQLAVNKDGIISGTLFNSATEEASTVQGKVDKETQRVAFRIGDSEDIVAETGLYNLTQDEAPLLVHFGTENQEKWLLVRLENPEQGQAAGTAASPVVPQ